MAKEANEPISVIVGLGNTGLSCAKYFAVSGQPFKVVDSRSNPPGLSELQRILPGVDIELGEFSSTTLSSAKQLVVSPGVSLKTEAIVAARKNGVSITGDIDIFSKSVSAPLIAVTGSNGKSTVVAIVAEILRCAGVNFGLGGNLDGANFKPALDMLQEGDKDFYVLELSSFQLETTAELGAAVAVVLNISPDHMDRYEDFREYALAKQAIFNGCKQIVVNRDEASSIPIKQYDVPIWSFGISTPEIREVGLLEQDGIVFIACHHDPLIAVSELKIVGQHNIANVMAAATLTLAAGIDREAIRLALRNFAGLPHRCQWVAAIRGVDYYNDSKGTNVGATVASVEGLGQRIQGRLVLIAGGVGKGADFSLLGPVVKRWTRAVILIGQDGPKIAAQLDADSAVSYAADMQSAVIAALQYAKAGDAVLLSPACASFDMFENFQHRGQMFIDAVESLL